MTITIVLTFLVLIAIVAIVAFSISVRRPPWRAISPSGSIDLGTRSYSRALAIVMSGGKPSYTDHERRIIFYDTHLGGAHPEGAPR